MRILAISNVCGRADLLRWLAEQAPGLHIDAVLFAGDALAGGRRVEEWLRVRAQGREPRRWWAAIEEQEWDDTRTLNSVLDALGAFGVPTFVIPGDLDAPERLFAQATVNHEIVMPNVVSVHRSFAPVLRNYAVVGFGGLITGGERENRLVLCYPAWEVKAGLDFARRLERDLIMLLHTPPRFGVLDRHAGANVGDPAVEELIHTLDPRLVVCGHAADGQGSATIGRSLVVNPGALREGAYAIIDLEARAVTFHRLEGVESEQAPADRQVQRHIEEALEGEPMTRGAGIRVAVRSGIARLVGTVRSIAVKAAAQQIAGSIGGVKLVENALTADSTLVARVTACLADDPRTALALIEVSSVGGQVTLSGTVGSPRVKEAAEAVAYSVPGVILVINELRVQQTDSPSFHQSGVGGMDQREEV